MFKYREVKIFLIFDFIILASTILLFNFFSLSREVLLVISFIFLSFNILFLSFIYNIFLTKEIIHKNNYKKNKILIMDFDILNNSLHTILGVKKYLKNKGEK